MSKGPNGVKGEYPGAERSETPGNRTPWKYPHSVRETFVLGSL